MYGENVRASQKRSFNVRKDNGYFSNVQGV